PSRTARPGDAGSLPALENHNRDLPVSSALVVVISRPDLGHALPQPRPLVALGGPGPDRDLLGFDLDRDVRICPEVLVPVRVIGGAALGRNHDPAVAVVPVDQRRGALGAGLPPG